MEDGLVKRYRTSDGLPGDLALIDAARRLSARFD
jgi:hypothetical protein